MQSCTKTFASSWLKDAILLKNIKGDGVKTYIEIRWMIVYKCTSSIWRLKDMLQHVYIHIFLK